MAGTKRGKPGTHERRLMESESRWLQKALFALSKADDDRKKLDDTIDEKLQPLTVTLDGKTFELGEVRDAMTDTIQGRVESLRESLGRGRAIAR